jgi:hypothetical protein
VAGIAPHALVQAHLRSIKNPDELVAKQSLEPLGFLHVQRLLF